MLSMLAAVGLMGVGACPGNMRFLGDTRLFLVEQMCEFSLSVPAVEGTRTATDFYDYYSASSHTGFEVPGRSFVFLYRDLNTPDELALFWLHGFDGTEQGEAEVHGRISGIPDGAHIAQADDSSNEFDWSNSLDWSLTTPTHGLPPDSPYIAGRWWFKSNTDGGALDRLSMSDDWDITVEVKFVSGMDDWRFFFADGSDQQLNTSAPLYIRSYKPEDPILPYPLPNERTTFCALVLDDSNTGNLTYTFRWGDGTPETNVSKAQSDLACAEHYFCHPEFGCGGVTPRNVTITVTNACGETVTKTLASELSTGGSNKPVAMSCPYTEAPPTLQPMTLVPTGTPTTGAPTTGAPTTGVPSTGTPTTGAPNTATPNTGVPTTGSPTTGTPSTGAPATYAPLPMGDTYSPDASLAPTTGAPTTGAPSTGTPSTGTPSTSSPSTGAPSTGSPNTGAPSTGSPSTGTPSTLIPSTGTPSEPTGAPGGTAVATMTPGVTGTLSPGATNAPGSSGGGGASPGETEAPKSDSSSGVPVAAIVVPLVLGVLGCGAAAFFVARKRGQEKAQFGKGVELGEVEKDAGSPTFGEVAGTEMQQDYIDFDAFEPEITVTKDGL